MHVYSTILKGFLMENFIFSSFSAPIIRPFLKVTKKREQFSEKCDQLLFMRQLIFSKDVGSQKCDFIKYELSHRYF